MTSDMQLTIDGREVPHEAVLASRRPRTKAQREVLRALQVHRTLSTSSIGRIVHDARSRPCTSPSKAGSDGCCKYAAADGRAMALRLLRRGLIEQIGRGAYALVEP